MNENTFYDAFAGIGGFRLGLERCAFQCVGSAEIDKHAREIYRKNFGEYPSHSDIRDFHAKPGEFKILTGGFPCQAFSFAGKRLGFEDTRGTLFFELARIAGEAKPHLLFFENVKGLLNHDSGRTFGTILVTLDELGYDVEWQVINGKYFVPQNRERIFIIGHLRGEPWKPVFPIIEDDQAPAVGQEQPEGAVVDATGCEGESGRALRRGQNPSRIVVRTITAGGHSGGLHSGMTVIKSGTWKSQGFETKKDDVAHCLRAGQGTGSRGYVAVLTPDRPEKRQNGRRFKAPTEPMFTLTAQDKHGVSDGQFIRRLTPTECERLMGFPDGWTKGVSDTARYRLLGNAVIPQIVELIGERLL